MATFKKLQEKVSKIMKEGKPANQLKVEEMRSLIQWKWVKEEGKVPIRKQDLLEHINATQHRLDMTLETYLEQHGPQCKTHRALPFPETNAALHL